MRKSSGNLEKDIVTGATQGYTRRGRPPRSSWINDITDWTYGLSYQLSRYCKQSEIRQPLERHDKRQ